MRRRDFLRSAAAAGVVVAGCLDDDPTPAFRDGFEGGMGDWESGAAIGPEVDLAEFEWSVAVSGERAAEGERSLRIRNEGDHDDGTTWAVHPVQIDAGRKYDATVTARFWSESESFNTIRHAVMRLGAEPPEGEDDFPPPGMNTSDLGEAPYGGLREPLWLTEGWREYAFEWTMPELPTDTASVAVGTSVVWEADATHFVDEVVVELEPR